ncbi:MAG: alpha/beta hydrolase [Proteobacteria bacterium]|nr:alpha/beta hydrolase [Pseudomonadota bacterium]
MCPSNRRRLLHLGLAGGVLPLLQACSPIALLERRVPDDTYRHAPDIAYGSHPRQRLDVYSPLDARMPAPVFVFFYGGAWTSGTRSFYRFVGEAMAARGIVTVVPDYRLYPEVNFPDFVDDSARAVRWTIDHAAAHGGDPSRVFIGGHSAGAYNAAMVAFDPRFAKGAGFDPRRLAGFVGMAGPYDFLPLTGRTTRAIFGWPDTPPSTQPINAVVKGAPRSLLLYATSDNLVAPKNSENLASRLREVGTEVKLVAYENLGHRTLVGSLARPLNWMGGAAEEIAAFIR